MRELIDRQALLNEYDKAHVGPPGKARKLIEDAPTASPWRKVEEELPKESNCYIVYLRQGTEMKTPDWMGGEPLSYVTEMGFDKGQMLWQNGDDAYNAILSAVDTKKDFHITHWMPLPEPPKEENK